MANFNQVETQPVIMLNVDGKHLNLDFIVATAKEVGDDESTNTIIAGELSVNGVLNALAHTIGGVLQVVNKFTDDPAETLALVTEAVKEPIGDFVSDLLVGTNGKKK